MVFEAVSWLDKGVLPHSGGWADQPADLMELATTVKAVWNERKTAINS